MTVAVAPGTADLERWRAADDEARPARIAAVRDRMAAEGVDAYYGVRRENTRYLTGFELREGEEKVAGQSGQFLVSADEVVVLADSRYTIQAAEQCPGARIERVYHDLPSRWPELLASLRPAAREGRVRRVAVEAGFVPFAVWTRLAEAAPGVQLVPVEGWVESLRQTKEPAEVERIRAACAVADAALHRLLSEIRPGRTEADLARQLEWDMRSNGAEALAFDVACLAGERAALPHGNPGGREVRPGEVLLFDFGAQVGGYRSDMTRTLFVGEPSPADLAIYSVVADAQAAAIAGLRQAAGRGERPTNHAIDALARDAIAESGYGDHFGHGLGHGIGLGTHEGPSLSPRAAEAALPAPTVFSVEPGVYLEGRAGVRIEDLVLFDPDSRRIERLTLFPREVTVVGS